MSDKAKLIFDRPIIGGSGAANNENCSVELLGLAIYGDYRHGYSLPCLDDAAQQVVVQVNDRLSDESRNSRRWRLLVARLALCHRHDNDRLHRRMALWCARSVEHLSDDPRVKACNDTLERWLAGEATDEQLIAATSAARSAAARAAVRAAWAAWAAAEAARAAAWAAAEAAAEAASWVESPSTRRTVVPMTQLELFNAPKARRSDPATSHEAAASAESWVTENSILTKYAIFGPMTDDELCARCPLWHDATLKTARSRLKNRGLLVDSGERRPSNRGRNQIVWRLS